MKKLGKKLLNSQETIEAYCMSCTTCSSTCNCPSCYNPGVDPQMQAAGSSVSYSNTNRSANASNARQGN